MKGALTTEERFMLHVEPEPNSGCWLWSAYCNEDGYGKLSRVGPGRKTMSAHRLSYELFVGTIPAGMLALHLCDQPCCVNPDHIRIGTVKDNTRDMAAKWHGRKSKNGLPFGVYRDISGNRKIFRARVNIDGKRVMLGNYSTAEEAHSVAVAAKMDALRKEKSR